MVRGYDGDDTLFGGEGTDTLRGEAGDDLLTGGEGADAYRIRASKWNEGADVVTDFELGVDKVVFVASDMLRADRNLDREAGDQNKLGLDDLQASTDYSLGASSDGDLVITHKTGTIELNGVKFDDSNDTFEKLDSILEIEVG